MELTLKGWRGVGHRTQLQQLVHDYGGWTNRKRRYEILGITSGHIGEMTVETVIDGVKWFVQPQISNCSHRLLVECPECLKIVSAGRIHQHAKTHNKGEV